MTDFDFKRTTPMPIKAEAVKKILRRDIDPNMTLKEMIVYTRRLISYRKGHRKQINGPEGKVKEVLDNNNLHPITVNEWLRYTTVPEDLVKESQQWKSTQGIKPFTSQKKILQLNEARIKKKKAEIGMMILELGRQAIYDLERLRYG